MAMEHSLDINRHFSFNGTIIYKWEICQHTQLDYPRLYQTSIILWVYLCSFSKQYQMFLSWIYTASTFPPVWIMGELENNTWTQSISMNNGILFIVHVLTDLPLTSVPSHSSSESAAFHCGDGRPAGPGGQAVGVAATVHPNTTRNWQQKSCRSKEHRTILGNYASP